MQQLVNLGVVWSTYDPLYTYEDDTDDQSDDGMEDAASRQSKGKGPPKRGGTDAMDEDDGEGWNDAAQSNGAGDDDWGDADDGAGADSGPAAATWGAEDEDSGGISAGSNDTSWKVRRAAVGVLSAFIKARSDLLKRSVPTAQSRCCAPTSPDLPPTHHSARVAPLPVRAATTRC